MGNIKAVVQYISSTEYLSTINAVTKITPVGIQQSNSDKVNSVTWVMICELDVTFFVDLKDFCDFFISCIMCAYI